ncbi:transcriptional regulator [Dietzia sp. SLG310A2-38A2]|uniref:helix-turn-helix transcriptional regulator n=1 Tax=Dietzia sp. SLG310A2-38A2 TaxID=1630643 RepID=UPI0015FBBE42|nr:transcriptional regulator [Dietzia sp. SLG310A2-38A2]MBB1032103.1 transcriptional regulator [Dietzia sp. SLG310A2-38A2]
MTGAPERTLALLSLLQSPRSWRGEELAQRLEVTTRTVRRDVDRLREMGYRIQAVKGPDGGYRMESGTELPPLRFDDEQAVAIAIALRHPAATGVEMGDAAHRALATVRQVMPSRLRHRVDGIQFDGAPDPTGVAPTSVAPDVVEAVSEAVRTRMTLRFGYRDPDAPSRRTQPHGVVARNGRWYLVAWDLDRDDWRTFRLDRMTPRTPTGPAFESRAVPTGTPTGFLASRSKGSAHDDGWPCVGEVEIDLPVADVARWVLDGEVVALSTHSTRVTIGSWSWAGVIAAVVRFDAGFRVLGPDGLLRAARELEARLAGVQTPRDGVPNG